MSNTPNVPANGNSKLSVLVINYLLPVIIAAGAGKLAMVSANAERTAVLEARVAEMDRRLQRIEAKLDRLIETHRLDR